MKNFVLNASTLIFLSFSSYAYSESFEMEMYKVEGKENHQKIGERLVGLSNGLSQGDISNNPNSQLMNGSKEIYNIGDYVVLCFRPPKSMYITLMDTSPRDKLSKIYPRGKENSRWVESNGKYCIGDNKSDTLLKMDQASGSGTGTLWLLGSIDKSHEQKINGFENSSNGLYALAFSASIIGSMVGEENTTGHIESNGETYQEWYSYEVK